MIWYSIAQNVTQNGLNCTHWSYIIPSVLDYWAPGFSEDRIFCCTYDQWRCEVPEWTPIRIQSGIPGRWRSWNVPINSKMSRAMWQMSTACRFPFRRGKPDATIYASPIVSTLRKRDGKSAPFEKPWYRGKCQYLVNITCACVCVFTL